MELEMGQLRNKLTMVDKKMENGTSKFKIFKKNYNNLYYVR